MDDLPLPLIAGIAAAVLAAVARLADCRRMGRSDPDAVGFMPWMTVFFWACLAAVLLLALGAGEWLGR
jgi:hypothetical protein